ncbi:MAG: hypothetical protein CL926_01455 [Deltaproteobacteria bacterium]|nr:hypothetical protein [Deltaproteobacteria bacterium]
MDSSIIIIFDVSYKAEFDVINRYIVDEEIPFIASLNQGNLVRFEWYFSPGEKTATLVEMAKDSDAWEALATKVIGSPVNLKFNDYFEIEKLTVLGEASASLRETIGPMSPIYRPYTAGFAIS